MNVAKTHLSLNTKDTSRSTAWFEAFIGVPTHKRRPGYTNFDLDSPGLKLALQQHAGGSGGPLNSNAWKVYALLDDMENEGDALGVSNCSNPVAAPREGVCGHKELSTCFA